MNNADFFSSLVFSISVTLPTVLMLLLGIALRKIQFIDDKFCNQATKLIFNITLPALLFLNVFKSPIDYSNQLSIVSIGILGTFILYFAAEIYAAKYVADKRERGTFVQGIYRGNNGILGIAFSIYAYGDAALAPASIYSAAVILIYNVLAVITLSRSLSDGKVSISKTIKSILKNPLIIALLVGMGFSQFQIGLPNVLSTTVNSLANVTLPLALICTGATINFSSLKKTSGVALQASIGRIFIVPIFMVLLAKCFGLTEMNMGILFLMSATPVAAATYAMVRGMGGNGETVANIIGVTTFASMITSALGLFILKQIGWI